MKGVLSVQAARDGFAIRRQDLSDRQISLMPNLFLIGAGKCGTTSLHSYLSAHPEITGSREKEPSFFVELSELRSRQLMESMRPEARDLDAYLDLFAGPPTRYRMEASPTYSSYPIFTNVPERIAAASPHAQIIYLVRNPVDRTISHYWQDRKILKENRSLSEAVADPDSIYLCTSDYKRQLDRYRPHFDNIHIVASEELRAAPETTLAGLFRALGLPEHRLDPADLAERNTTAATTRMARFPLVTTLRDTPTWNRLRARLPRGVLRALRKATVKEVPRRAEEENEVRAALRDHFLPIIREFDQTYGTCLCTRWFGDEKPS
ncbi:sulfotransferase [Paracoccus sp. MBLB3053]|uniref:Sulfotransferase n=1 Tax=Paracoccus aurantius TaxID=3073814 RepID=A0ABU2HV46_9RHOB|nr:sulfotransferase [Paracoccus sp. MBLB3053]MDS9468923.1 sulfotransferase [Paracoccus sp. MBLB3053]